MKLGNGVEGKILTTMNGDLDGPLTSMGRGKSWTGSDVDNIEEPI